MLLVGNPCTPRVRFSILLDRVPNGTSASSEESLDDTAYICEKSFGNADADEMERRKSTANRRPIR